VGFDIHRSHFEEGDYERFTEKLHASLRALRTLLARPGFGVGEATLGTELELHLTTPSGRPAHINRAVLAAAVDERVTLEMDRFNMEINTRPCALEGRPFEAMAAELESAIAVVRAAARTVGADVVMIGILPTLTEADLQSSALSDRPRYRALSEGIRRARGEPAKVRIDGRETLEVSTDDVTFEGANTSFQVHLRVAPEHFARTYNAVQIATAFVLAVAGNSPLFLGRRLWEETRVALFRRAVDDRASAAEDDWRPSRVSFGHGWVRTSALELFAESVHLHPPLIPEVTSVDPEAVVEKGGVPPLRELRLHHGTVWRWNRAVYDDSGGGHLRIEMRALPAGPTVRDMVANAALAIGLTIALARESDALVTRMTFGHARRNFYDAARFGLDAGLLWPAEHGPSPVLLSPTALADRLIELAREGLISSGVDVAEADAWLGIVAERIARRATGARWQRGVFDEHALTMTRDEAAFAMLRRYRELSDRGEPVHEWPSRGSG
jgi:hypothetical protein